MNKVYIAIDLKSFYASVECVDRHFDALTTNLVVADESRTEKTLGLENCFVYMAREAVFECMVYI